MERKKILYFITSNKSKFEEARGLLSNVVQLEQLDIDLPEIQEIDGHKVVRAKLKEATAHHSGPFIVDDVSVHFPVMGGLPGPLIKWFLASMEREQIHEMLKKLGDTRAQVKLIVGYARNHDDIHFFDGAVEGAIVAPRGSRFGWDPIFQPDGHQKTYAEMTPEEKNKISHRAIALKKLKKFLQN